MTCGLIKLFWFFFSYLGEGFCGGVYLLDFLLCPIRIWEVGKYIEDKQDTRVRSVAKHLFV